MDHNKYKELLSAFLDGELNEAERADVLAHLETCEACQTYLAELTKLRDALGDMEDIDVPEGFAGGVLARLHGENAPQAAKKRRAWRGVAGLAACAALVLLAGSMWRFTHMGMGAVSGNGASGGTADGAAPAAAESFMTTASNAPEPFEEAEYAADAASAPADGGDVEEYAAEEPAAPMLSAAGAGDFARNEAEEKRPDEDAPVLALRGEGAEEWLAEHGEPLGGGRWLVTVEAVNALPDTLELVAADGLREPADGTLVVTLGTTEDLR